MTTMTTTTTAIVTTRTGQASTYHMPRGKLSGTLADEREPKGRTGGISGKEWFNEEIGERIC